MRNAKELVEICIEEFYSKKRNCGIVVQGGSPRLRVEVVSTLRNMLDVSVFTPDFKAEGQYVFDIGKYL